MLSADRWDDRHIAEGRLGCPVCRAEYPITDGVADFTRSTAPPRVSPTRVPDESAMLRLAAQLDLSEPGGVIVLAGGYAPLAALLAGSFPALYAVLNAPASHHAVSAFAVAGHLPFAQGSLRALALDVPHAALVADAARVLRPGGRLVVPSGAVLADTLSVLASDDRELVATATAATTTPVIPLRRR